MNDYIRYPSEWKRTEEVFHILDKETADHVEVTVACAVQALNVYYLPDFIKWENLNKTLRKSTYGRSGAGGINYHFVYHPPHLNVKVLPQWFKEATRKKYEEFYIKVERELGKVFHGIKTKYHITIGNMQDMD